MDGGGDSHPCPGQMAPSSIRQVMGSSFILRMSCWISQLPLGLQGRALRP